MKKNLKAQFLIDPEITFLNFGSFGATPKPVFDKYQQLQRQMELQPVQFVVSDGIKLLKEAREKLAAYVHCNADDLVYVTNPSYAINAIAKSFPLSEGDEILATNLEYGALDRTWDYYCDKAGAKYVRQNIQLPIKDKETFLNDFWKGYSSNTKAIFISQITSFTGLILPVKEICEEAKKRGLITIVDGAHVPGHIDLNISNLQADVYTGACHKWMMAPKGASFLYVSKEHQHWVDPLVISWGFKSDVPSHSQFLDYHQMNGTRDYTAFLAVPACIDFMNSNNWQQVSKECKELVLEYAPKFCELTNTKPLAPLTSEFFGQLFSIPIQTSDPLKLKSTLWDTYKIEVPVMVENDRVYLRYSINAFNSAADLDRLYAVLVELKGELWTEF
ncbi:MAG: isopenicillin-N epimerase [Saprospiraceae bacterium]|jgi:isopenicillin-N epimerase